MRQDISVDLKPALVSLAQPCTLNRTTAAQNKTLHTLFYASAGTVPIARIPRPWLTFEARRCTGGDASPAARSSFSSLARSRSTAICSGVRFLEQARAEKCCSKLTLSGSRDRALLSNLRLLRSVNSRIRIATRSSFTTAT